MDLQDKLNKDGVKTEVVNLEQETFWTNWPNYEVISYSLILRRLIHDRYNQIFDHYDVLVFPTTTFAPTWESGKPNVWTSEYCAVSKFGW
ncbi:hypothetical protein [Mycoplasma sp. ATU-Cv-508]|uniref:hypothetical protein n=1 Tax=Mycoplasma sp. ATU-Cv-508 TaxID=2048001 RepID=UPI0011E4D773